MSFDRVDLIMTLFGGSSDSDEINRTKKKGYLLQYGQSFDWVELVMAMFLGSSDSNETNTTKTQQKSYTTIWIPLVW